MAKSEQDEKFLKEVRDTFDYYSKCWRDIREEGREDMAYLSGDPWTADERKEREDAKRPCIALDELNQYVNQIVNDVRMNKRSIKVTPVSEDATDKTAEARQGLIRGIEYESNAQTAYTTAFEGAVMRGYGYARVCTEYSSAKGFNQVIRIKRIPNPDTVLIDPDSKEYDCSDAMGCFVIDVMTHDAFKSKYPHAKKTSFDADDMRLAPSWIKDKSVVVAEFWKVKLTNRTLLLLDEQGTTAYLDELKGAKLVTEGEQEFVEADGKRTPILNSRKCEERELTQYVVNGVEKLETNPQPKVKYIPIIPCFGKEVYLDDGSGAKRVLMSLIRLARDPYKMYCYIRSQEAEEAAMTPRAPFVVYKGQLDGQEDQWRDAHVVPQAYLEVNPVLDATGAAVLPLPTRPQFTPNFQAYEMTAESMKRAIQSACGMYNSSTGNHDTNVKSGKAIKALDTQSSQGNFHFVDNYDRFMQHVGRVIDERIPIYYDTARQVGLRKPDDTHKLVRINDPEYRESENSDPTHYDVKTGEHDVTVGTGPSFESQREEAATFVDAMIQNLATLPISPELKSQLLALSIQLKQLGPIGDQMVELLKPPTDADIPPQVKQVVAQLNQKLQAMNAYAQNLEAEKKKLEDEKAAKIVDNQYKMEVEKLKAETSLAMAEVNTKAQNEAARVKLEYDLMMKKFDMAHDAASGAAQAATQGAEADAARQHEADMQAGDQAHQATMQESQQAAAAQSQTQAEMAAQQQQGAGQ